jgi:hypothetical protein
MAKLKPLVFEKNKLPYDSLINSIRTAEGLPLNRSLLARIATDSYVQTQTKNGKFDSRHIVQYFKEKNAERLEATKKERLEKREASLKAKLEEVQKAKKEIKA